MTLDELQAQQAAWACHSFGLPEERRWEQPFLGVVEEVGELSHALLKQDQGIRGSREEHEAAAQDAVGDIVIYLADLCTLRGWDLAGCVEAAWSEVSQRDWRRP